MFLSLVLSNTLVIPFDSPVYSQVINGILVPLAIPLLLFDSDLKKIVRQTGTMLQGKAKRRSDNAIASGENRTRSRFNTRHTSSI